MAEQSLYLIIGNGIAGATAAELLREEDAAAAIMVVADDPFPVYYRPALKDYLAGRVREDKLWARSTSYYQDHNIHYTSDRVVKIQPGQHLVQLQSGRQLGYTRLLLAHGASAARLRCPGLDLKGVTTLRSVADYQAVQGELATARSVVVTGSGTLALETIETLRHRGYQVTHLIRRHTLWSEVLDATASDLVLQQERRDGVEVRLEEEIAEIVGKQGHVTGVVTTRGAQIACDVVIIAIGIEPNLDFVKSSGIACGRGIKVDGMMRTNAPDIFAAGDVLETTDMTTGKTRVIGQWYPAIQQARAAAYSMLDLLDTKRPFRPGTFYNATFLYGLDFASVGLTNAPGYKELVADPQPRTYRKVLLKDGVPVGMLSLGNRRQALAFKRAIDHQVNLSPVVSRLFADDFKLDDWLDSQGVPSPLLGASREGDTSIERAVRAEAGETQARGVTMIQPQSLSEAWLVPATSPDEGVKLPETLLSQIRIITVGRHAGAHLLIDHGSISRRHAEIGYNNGQYVLHDLGSTNGTFVNGKRMEAGGVHVLRPDDRLRFGTIATFTFTIRTQAPQARSAPPRGTSMPGVPAMDEMETTRYNSPSALLNSVPEGQPVLNPDGSLQVPKASSAVPAGVVAAFKEAPALVIIAASAASDGKSPPLVYLLKKGKHITLGRDKHNDIVLADASSSRKHAEIFPGPDGFYMRDLGSSNGLFINQTKIDNPYLLSHGDRITIGGSTIYYIHLQAVGETPPKVPAASAAPAPVPQKAPSPPQTPVATAPPAQPQRPPVQVTVPKGVSLRVCPKCGVANSPVARFCASCSTPLGTQA